MRLIILGAGGHGQVVADIASQLHRYDAIHFLDDVEDGLGKCEDFTKFIGDDTEFYIAFGNNEVRMMWLQKVRESHGKLACIIHPLAYVSPKAIIADGCVVMPYAIVNTHTTINQGCIINVGAIVDHDCILEDGCHIAPGGIVKAMNHVPSKTKVDGGVVIPLNYYV